MYDIFVLLSFAFNGFLLGIIVTICSILYILLKLHKKSQEKPDIVENNSNDESIPQKRKIWPDNIKEYLKNPPLNSLTWLNLLIHRYFIECINSNVLKAKLKQKLTSKLTSSIINSVEFVDIQLGNNPPFVNSITPITPENPSDVSLELNVDYAGGFHVHFITTLHMGIKIPVKLTLSSFKSAKIQLRLPSPVTNTQYALGFVQDPGIEFEIDCTVENVDNEVLKGFLNGFLVRKLRLLFCDLFILPNFRSFDLPMINYVPFSQSLLDAIKAEEKHEKEKEKLLKEDDKKEKEVEFNLDVTDNTENVNSNSLSRGGGFSELRKRANSVAQIKDVLQNKCFSVSSSPTSANYLNFVEQLTAQFKILSSAKTETFTGDYQLQWETVRNKKQVHIQKSTFPIPNSPQSSSKQKTELIKAVFTVKCDYSKCFQILSNFEHLRHVDDLFVDSLVLEKFSDEVLLRRVLYRIGGKEKVFYLFECKARLDDGSGFFVCYRSVKRDKSSNTLTVPDVNNITNTVDGIIVSDSESTLNSSSEQTVLGSNLDRTGNEFMSITPKAAATSIVQSENAVAELSTSPNTIHKTVEQSLSSGSNAPVVVTNNTNRNTIFSVPLSRNRSNSSVELGILYLGGYLVEKISDYECQVTSLSQYGRLTLQKLEVNFGKSLKVKMFVEELAEWSFTLGELNKDIGGSSAGVTSMDDRENKNNGERSGIGSAASSRRGSTSEDMWRGFYKKAENGGTISSITKRFRILDRKKE